MESEDGITVRPMRLKVFYTFDNENKTNCLARWPHVLDLQTAYLDEQTQIGVIELKTCIQAIVSASPELVAHLGKDYTVYAYDYSEYETPLVGQGMLSWVLASASPTPDAPAHQSKTMVTGRVCKNPVGLFSKGVHETLEVKLRLVPVPTVMQSEYLDSMQKYRELSNVIPQDFDAQSWTNFFRQNPALLEASRSQNQASGASPKDQSGIERVHQLLSDSTTPREYPSYSTNESIRSSSPTHSFGPPSRMSTPAGTRTPAHNHQALQSRQNFSHSDMIRPSSSASMRDNDHRPHPFENRARRDSFQSGYGSGGEDGPEPQQRKRAKLYQAGWPGKSDMNIERQPSSLRVAASTAASVRIHRPTPINPASRAEQSQEEPIRPPTPISNPLQFSRRARLPSSLLRESSTQSNSSYTSPYQSSDDQPQEQLVHSPEDRYQGLFEAAFNMPSSPPVMESRFPTQSSPNLPPFSIETDSGFMSGSLDDFVDDGAATPVEETQKSNRRRADGGNRSRSVLSTVQATSPMSATGLVSEVMTDPMIVSETVIDLRSHQAAQMPRPSTSSGSRPSSRASARPTPKSLAPAPMSQSEIEHMMRAAPTGEPGPTVQPPSWPPQAGAGIMSDFSIAETPPPQPESSRKAPRSGGGARRAKQVQAKLDAAIAEGIIPPLLRVWTKDIVGTEQDAKKMQKQQGLLFWEATERNDQQEVARFRIYKKGLGISPEGVTPEDEGWNQLLLCNPCGLWIHKFRTMRPPDRWNGKPPASTRSKKAKRPPKNRKRSGGLPPKPSTRARSKANAARAVHSSPAPTDASFELNGEGETPNVDKENDPRHDTQQTQDSDDEADHPSKRRRANSAEPTRSTEKSGWDEGEALDALRLAIQSSPARNMETRKISATEENNLTPKPVRRALFASSQKEGPLKELGSSMLNSCSPRRSPRLSRTEKQMQAKENMTAANDAIDELFEGSALDFDLPVSPTPRRRLTRPALHERRQSLPCNSPTGPKRDTVSAENTTRLAAERLQHIQDSPSRFSRIQASPKKSPAKRGSSALPDISLQPEPFTALDGMILDIFEDLPTSPNLFQLGHEKFSSNNWADWLPSNYVSPAGSGDENGSPDALIDSIFSDETLLKEDNLNSHFNPFNFAAGVIPDSGFFSSDALPTDVATSKMANALKEHKQSAPSDA
ncbi:hypothetical protein N7539_003937 [Penicillium diatomitis]|uniref:Ams2/SPT21 N-terminal domain-containing protein n=1 Tax=Penicillium diatomitis TaxID=2819901 RepID=A0A9W9XD12_9EURO|nr:uncharacterized protein N7539_003937 [Penicillium diatomitis]KAJ5489047.1 hypothetical protein N7539_003937 [Penicillium diatomitis]